MTAFTFLSSLIAIVLFGSGCYYLFKNSEHKIEMSYKQSKIVIWSLFGFSFCFVLLAICIDQTNHMLLNANQETIDYTKVGAFGDLIGGLLNPIIAFTGIIAASLAFYVQYLANKQVQEQFKVQQFESQFYEMLRLHKENVNEIEIEIIDFKKNSPILVDLGPPPYISTIKTIKGRDTFIYFSNELEIAFRIYQNALVNINDFDFTEPYRAFFHGLNYLTKSSLFYKEIDKEVTNFENEFLIYKNKKKFNDVFVLSTYNLFEGHENKLGHYYRHLFHTVKFIVEQKSGFINYAEKRKYLRLLRAQLSNYEQAMLFYNYLAYAEEWEVGNKYLTDYRIIHNLYENVLIQDSYFKKEYRKLMGKQKDVKCYKENDHIFEAQKWD